MMHYLIVFWVLLSGLRYAGVQAQTAIWEFPTSGKNLQANTIDTVLLNWTSTLPSTILRMWCQNGTDENHFALASSFYVDSTGPFKYVMDTYETDERAFPLSCHAELAENPRGSGFDSPAGIVWSSDSAKAAKTISETQAAATTSQTQATKTTSRSSSATSIPLSATGSITTDSLSPPTTLTLSTKQPATLSTTSSESPSGVTTASHASTSTSSSNIGAIVGGVIGGVALISFIILALLFLRKYQRDRAFPSPTTNEPSTQGFRLLNVFKGGANGRTTGVFEKEGDHGVYETEGFPRGEGVQEKDGSDVLHSRETHELQGSVDWQKTMSRGGGWAPAGSEGEHAIRYSPVELPGGSNYYP